MKKHLFRIAVGAAFILGVIALLSSGNEKEAPATPAAITGINITDPGVLARHTPIVVTFGQAMVTESALNKDVEPGDMPFRLSPPVAGKGRWLTDKSFAFAADSDFAPGTAYSLFFAEHLKSLDGRPARWVLAFNTEAVTLRQVQPGVYNAQARTMLLHFDFSAIVSQKALAGHMRITDAHSGEELPLDFSESPEQGQSHTVLVRLGALRSELMLSVRKDAPGDAQPLGLGAPYAMKLELPAPGEGGVARLAGTSDEASPIAFYQPYASENEDGVLYARAELTQALADQHQKEFIEVSPALPFTIGDYGTTLLFNQGLEPNMQVTLTLKKGLTDSAGRVLDKDVAASFSVPDYDGAVRFAQAGNFLTPLFGSRVAVTIINADSINVSLKRLYDNNLPFMSMELDSRAKDLMRDLALQEIPVKGLARNELRRQAVDLDALAKGKRGVFVLSLTAFAKESFNNTGETYNRYCGRVERMVVLTDIGVTARTFPSGITVLATGLSSARPLRDAAVKVYSNNNQLIARGFTDENGLFVHQRAEKWDEQLAPAIVTVQSGEGDEADMTFLPLSYENIRNEESAALRPYLESGYEAFVYTARGVFRPGEKVDLKTFVRGVDHEAPQPFPVLFKVMSSRWVEVARGAATLSEQGGADFSFTLPASASTGTYTVHVCIPGQENEPLGDTAFAVEDFVPPRLELALAPDKDQITAGENLEAALTGRYLFGAPGAGLQYELGYRVWADSFKPEGFDGYSFGDAEKRFENQVNLRYLNGELSDSGEQHVTFTPPADWAESPFVLKALLVASVREDGGRWVNRTAPIRYFPTPWLLGLKPEGSNFEPGNELAIDMAALTPEGQAQESGPLKAEISLIQGNWHTVYRNNRYIYNYTERLVPQALLDIPSAKGKNRFTFTPEQPGLYLVRVVAENGIAASCRVGVYGADGASLPEGTGRMDIVELSLDKKDYLPGETAKLTVKAPFAGTLLLGLEKGKQLSARVLAMEEPGMVVDIPVTEGMDPNVTVTASVIRPVRGENREWYSHRAYGAASLRMAKTPFSLTVSPAAPERALPQQPLSVPFTITDHHGVPVEGEFSVALVDEGILSLTDFQTPDPLGFFMGARYAVGASYDAFDALLRPEAKATALLTPGGGASMAAMAYQGSLGTQPVFLAEFVATVNTDANGQGEALFAIPEYSGKGRIMIVGASNGRFASGEAPIRFAREVVLEASTPRVAAPGDIFDLSMRLFVTPEDKELESDILVRLSTEGPVSIQADTEFTVPPGKDATARSLVTSLAAGSQEGLGLVRIAVSVAGRDDLSFEKEVQVAVRPPYARSSASVFALLKAGESEELILPGLWAKGRLTRSFSLAPSPVMGLLPALEYLKEYPYSCLEQLVSCAWPYLALHGAALPGNAPLAAQSEAHANNATTMIHRAVSAITSLQRPGGGFAVWPDRGAPDPWRSVYALWFLHEVKDRVPVSKQVLEAGADYLRFVLAAPADALGSEAEALSTKAFAAMVLARNNEAPLGWMQHLSGHTEKMLPSGRIFLAGAMALKAGNSAPLRTLAEKPEALTFNADNVALNRTMESDVRNKALLLWLWSQVEPGAPVCRDLCLDVITLLGKQSWFSVHEAGVAALAAGSWLERAGVKAGPYNATITEQGEDTPLAEVKDGASLLLASLPTPVLQGDAALPSLTVSLEGQGSAYAVYSVRGVPLGPPPPASNGLVISRVWKDAHGKIIDLASDEARLKQGDRVIVELTVQSERPLNDIVLSDLLPGGLEVENARLQNAAQNSEYDDNQESNPAALYVDQREDRMLLFFDRLDGTATYSYSARAVSKGSFVLPPLAADAMYDPQINAVTGAGRLVVE